MSNSPLRLRHLAQWAVLVCRSSRYQWRGGKRFFVSYRSRRKTEFRQPYEKWVITLERSTYRPAAIPSSSTNPTTSDCRSPKSRPTGLKPKPQRSNWLAEPETRCGVRAQVGRIGQVFRHTQCGLLGKSSLRWLEPNRSGMIDRLSVLSSAGQFRMRRAIRVLSSG